MKILKMKVGIDKSKLIKSEKRIVACGKNFENVMKLSPIKTQLIQNLKY